MESATACKESSSKRISELEQDVEARRQYIDEVIQKVHPVLENMRPYDLPELAVPAGGRPQQAAFLQDCRRAAEYFKYFAKQAVETAATHVLSLVRSHNSDVDVEVVAAGYAPGTNQAIIDELNAEVTPAARRIAGDVEHVSFQP